MNTQYMAIEFEVLNYTIITICYLLYYAHAVTYSYFYHQLLVKVFYKVTN